MAIHLTRSNHLFTTQFVKKFVNLFNITGAKLYTTIFNRHWAPLLGYCKKKIINEDAAKDMAEFAFTKLWDKFPSITTDSHAKHFLYRVAQNACMNELQHKRHAYIDIENIDLCDDLPLDFDIINADVIAFVYAEIDKLPAGMRTAIKLLLTGMDSTQAAEQLHTTRKTLLNNRLAGIAKIKSSLALKLKFEL